MARITVNQFRVRLGERIPATGTEADTLFKDDELQETLDAAGENWYWALADGWAVKAGVLAELIDTNESGSERKLSQQYEHAFKMWGRYSEMALKFDTELGASTSRVVGKGFDAFCARRAQSVVSIFPEWAYRGDGHLMYDSKPIYPVERGLP